MIDYIELKRISMEFRRTSSNLLCSSYDTANIQIQRFKKHIDDTPFISTLIAKNINDVNFDYKDCFTSRDENGFGWSEMIIPVDEKCHLKAMYDYLSAIVANGSNVYGAATAYYGYPRNFDEAVRQFLKNAFKPLIDFIIDAISKEMIVLESTSRNGSVTQQVFGNNYGSLNSAGGDVHSNNTLTFNSELSKEILEIINKLLPSINDLNLECEEKDNLLDDLEIIREEISSETPRKIKLRKAYTNIQEFTKKLSVAAIANKLVATDWQNLLDKLAELLNCIN